MKRYTVKFRYADAMSGWKWRTQQCSVYANSERGAREECIELYGLGTDCEYEIISIEEEKN